MSALRGVTWDHPRGIRPLEAAAAAFARNTRVQIEWTARPLASFEETPLAILAEDYDLIALDHPFIGDAVAGGVLTPLDDLLGADALAERAADAVGLSHRSYAWEGRHWAVGIDAACMVSAHRRAFDGSPGKTWPEALAYARALGRERVRIAANPIHLWGTLQCLCEASTDQPGVRDATGLPAWWHPDGIERNTLVDGLERLRELLDHCAAASLDTDPIGALTWLSAGTGPGYVPLVFGYVTYARPNMGERVRFADAPDCGEGPRGTLTGGVGLAVSATSTRTTDAAAFLAFASSADVQRELFVTAGGQPGRRSAWTDPAVNAASGNFFADTVTTTERAFLRPRVVGYPAFQTAVAERLHELVRERASAGRIADALARLWATYIPARSI